MVCACWHREGGGYSVTHRPRRRLEHLVTWSTCDPARPTDLHRQRPPGAGRRDLPLARHPHGSRRGVGLLQRQHLRAHLRERARARCLPRAVGGAAGQCQLHGAADHDRRRAPGQRRPHHGRDPLLPLRPLRQEGSAARPDHGPADRQSAGDRGREPHPDDGSARRPDTGLLQHPHRRTHRAGPAGRRRAGARVPRRRGRARPGQRQAGAQHGRTAGRAAGPVREAARGQRRQGAGLASDRRRGPARTR